MTQDPERPEGAPSSSEASAPVDERTPEPNLATAAEASVSPAPVAHAEAAPGDAEGAPPPDAPADDAPSDDAPSDDAPALAEGVAADAADDEGAAAEGNDAGDADGEGAAADADAAAGPSSEPGKKKRRRKRKKKGPPGEAAEAAPDGDAKKKDTSVPFQRFFEGPHALSRKHAFSVGEVVAGRVTHVHEGAFVVDLFGKATAVVDAWEPREVPMIVEPPEPEEAEAPAHAAEVPGDAAAAASDTTAEAASDTTAAAASDTMAADAGDGAALAEETTAEAAADDGAAPAGDAMAEGASDTAAQAGADAGVAPGDDAMAEASDRTAEARDEGPSPADDGAAHAADETSTPDETSAPPLEVAAADRPGDLAAYDAESAAPLESVPPEDDEEDVAAEPEGPPPEPPPLGTIFRGRVGAVSENGNVALVNRVVDRPKVKARLEHAREKRVRVRGVVFGFNRGGFDVVTDGVRVFCPASGMALEPIDDPHVYVGQKLEFLIAPTKSSGQGWVVTRRSILEREARKAARDRLKSLGEGQDLDGRVTSIREFGVLVDIGGIEGLVHLSELGWQRGLRPSEVVRVGDAVRVRVLKVGGPPGGPKATGPKKRETRVSLSMKALLPDPWDEHAEVLREGQPRKGKVVRTTEFGAFVELAPGVEGLLHISELGKDLKHASLVLDEGAEIDVVVERVDRKQRRLSLSRLSAAEVQALAEGQFDAGSRPKAVKPGSYVQVVVDKVDHAGLVVRVAGAVGRRARGFLPNRELGERGVDTRKAYPPGTELEVKVVGIDRDGGLRCSLRAKEVDEERRAVHDYRREAAKQGFGTFGDLLRAKLGEK